MNNMYGSGQNSDMQSRQQSTQSSSEGQTHSQGVNAIRASSGVRNKPQSNHNQVS